MTEGRDEKVGAMHLITVSEDKLRFTNPRKDVYCARMPIAGNVWIDSGVGVI